MTTEKKIQIVSLWQKLIYSQYQPVFVLRRYFSVEREIETNLFSNQNKTWVIKVA